MIRVSGPVGVAIIGTRFGNLHAEALAERPDRARIIAICARTEEHARQSAERWGAEIGTTSFEAVLQHPDVDAVHLCVPHDLHAPMAMAAARAGKHVLTEKPIATTIEEADAMIEAARASDTLLMVSLNQRFLLHHQRAKTLVEAGAIGAVFLGHSAFLGFSPIKGWRFDAAQVGGGALIDSGMHRIDLLRWMAGEVVSVQAASGRFAHMAMQGEDTAAALLRFANGAIGYIVCSWAVHTPVREESLMLAGTLGTLWTDNRDLSVRHTNGQEPPVQEVFPDVTYPDSVKRLVWHFLDCLQTDVTPLITAEDGREALRIALAVYESVSTGREVFL